MPAHNTFERLDADAADGRDVVSINLPHNQLHPQHSAAPQGSFAAGIAVAAMEHTVLDAEMLAFDAAETFSEGHFERLKQNFQENQKKRTPGLPLVDEVYAALQCRIRLGNRSGLSLTRDNDSERADLQALHEYLMMQARSKEWRAEVVLSASPPTHCPLHELAAPAATYVPKMQFLLCIANNFEKGLPVMFPPFSCRRS